MSTDRKWYAVYTKPRWEKKVFRTLSESGHEAYCPLNKVNRKWSDRIKKVDEPLFKSYVFIRLAAAEQPGVRLVNGVLNFVYWNGKPAVVKDREIEEIRRFLNEHTDVQLEPIAVEADDRVQIRSGVMMDRKATVRKVFHNRVEVEVESLGYKLVAYVERSNLKLLSQKNPN